MIPDPSIQDRAAEAVAEVRQFGSTVLRDAWPADHLASLRKVIADHLEQRDRMAADGTLDPRQRMLHSHRASTIAQIIGFDAALIARMFKGSLYHQVCAEFLQDDEFYVALNRLAFRNHDPKGPARTLVPFHQDSGTQNPRVTRVLNCWIPLDPGCGRSAPGLQVVREVGAPNFPLKDFGLQSGNAVYDSVTIDTDAVMTRFGDLLLAPEFDVGDGFVFSQDVIHRTYLTPEMTMPRLNFEFRVFSPRNLAPGVSLSNLDDPLFRVA